MERSLDTIVREGGIGEITEKKSRFIAQIVPVTTEEEAAAFLASVKKKYWDAKHHCSAFVIGSDGRCMRSNDDGEPSGTAGRPILETLLDAGVYNAMAVVTRYFGGTLLGTGGLIRAYRDATAEALSKCVLLKQIAGVRIDVTMEYTFLGKVENIARSLEIPVYETGYGKDAEAVFYVEESLRETFLSKITEATNGGARITVSDPLTFGRAGEEIFP